MRLIGKGQQRLLEAADMGQLKPVSGCLGQELPDQSGITLVVFELVECSLISTGYHRGQLMAQGCFATQLRDANIH